MEGDDSSRGRLTYALKVTGDAYNDIGKLYEEQPKFDWEPLADKFHIYKGIRGPTSTRYFNNYIKFGAFFYCDVVG